MSVLSHIRTLLIDLDLIIFITATLLTGFVSLILSRYQTVRPFFPQDGTLYNVFTDDTIPTAALFFLHYLILAPLIYLSETLLLRRTSLPPRRARLRAARLALGMLSATMLAVLIVEMGKGYVGRLRPSFANLCLGNIVPPEDRGVLAPIRSDSACATKNLEALHDARRSFPSGHAGLGVGGAAYMQLYAAYAAPRIMNKAARLAVYGGGWTVFAFGAWVAASRVMDNAHHVSDVAVGAFIGVWAAVAHFYFVVADFRAEDRGLKDEVAEKMEKVDAEDKDD